MKLFLNIIAAIFGITLAISSNYMFIKGLIEEIKKWKDADKMFIAFNIAAGSVLNIAILLSFYSAIYWDPTLQCT